MSVWEPIKETFSRYLDRLEKENKEMFGSGRPDCCTLNRKQMPQKPTKQDQGQRPGGCNPWPIFPENKTVTGESISISYDYLNEATQIFANWKANS